MGTQAITQKQAGQTASQDDVNQYFQALVGDFVPRNAQGAVQAGAGSCGTDLYPWTAIHANDLFIDGQRINFGAGGQSATIENGVLSALGTPANARNWLRQAGSNGVAITASDENPLQVQVGGTTYTLTANLTGGSPLPSNYTQAVALQSAGNGALPAEQGDIDNSSTGVALDTLLASGGVFKYSNTEAPDAQGDTFIFKVSDATRTEYIVASRAEAPETLTGGFAKLAIRGALNTATGAGLTVTTLPTFTATQAMTQVRAGHIFADPTTATWTLAIEARVRTAVYQSLPASGNSAGDMCYRALDHRWYRYSGTAWVRTARVYLGICAIESGAVVGVMPVLAQEALNQMDALATRLLTMDGLTRSLDNPVHLRCDIASIESQNYAVLSYYDASAPGDPNAVLGSNYISRAAQTYMTQNAFAFEPRAVFSLEGTSSTILANGRQVFLYASAVDGSIYASNTLPTFINRGNLLYGIDVGNMAGVLLSSFAIDTDGNYIDHPASPTPISNQQRFPYLFANYGNQFRSDGNASLTFIQPYSIGRFNVATYTTSQSIAGNIISTTHFDLRSMSLLTMKQYAEQLFEESGE